MKVTICGLQIAGIRASAKKFPGGSNGKKDRKIAKKTENSTIKPLPEGEPTKKTRKIAKKAENSLYLLYLYHV